MFMRADDVLGCKNGDRERRNKMIKIYSLKIEEGLLEIFAREGDIEVVVPTMNNDVGYTILIRIHSDISVYTIVEDIEKLVKTMLGREVKLENFVDKAFKALLN